MPHNRTRLWVGVAIAAVTIPAVGTYYYGSSTNGLRGTPIVAAARWDSSTGQGGTLDASPITRPHSPRNYQAELDAALSKQGTTEATEPFVGSDKDPNFDIGPLDDLSDLPIATPRSLPEPAADVTSDPSATAAMASDVSINPNPVANVAATGDLSDGDVYRLVTNSLSEGDREEFVRAYSAMTPDQRADLIDSFRDQIQGGTGR